MKRKHSKRQGRGPTSDELRDDRVICALRSCAQRLLTASWTCSTLAPTITGFVDDLRSGYSTHDLPIESLREASIAAGELTAICLVQGWSVEDALAEIHVRDELFYDRTASK